MFKYVYKICVRSLLVPSFQAFESLSGMAGVFGDPVVRLRENPSASLKDGHTEKHERNYFKTGTASPQLGWMTILMPINFVSQYHYYYTYYQPTTPQLLQ